MKLNYIIIPLATIAVSFIGSRFTSVGISSGWYDTIAKPGWTPPGSVIGAVWTVLFILATISALLAWNKLPHDSRFQLIIVIFIANAILNVLWSYLFFSQHLIGPAVWEAGLLGLTVIVLVVLLWPLVKAAALLLLPYALWVAFATYLTYSVWRLNL